MWRHGVLERFGLMSSESWRKDPKHLIFTLARYKFVSKMLAGRERGVAIIGMPSLESQPYASEQSRLGHVNCKSAPDLKALMEDFFHNVFMFSMNDEVVHTGFHKMAHYIFALCCTK
jgi:hypothetical protein